MFGACGVDVHFWGFLRFGVRHDGIDSVGFRLMDVFWESIIVATKRILIICIRIAQLLKSSGGPVIHSLGMATTESRGRSRLMKHGRGPKSHSSCMSRP